MSAPAKSVKEGLEALRAGRDWAKQRIAELNARVSAIVRAHPYKHRQSVDAKTGELVSYLHSGPTYSKDLSFLLGESVQALRDSLDHLVFSCATLVTGKERLMYPFGKDVVDLQGKLKGLSALLHTDVLKAIESTRPYKGGNEDLWLLNGLCNTKKHEMVLGLVETVAGMTSYDMIMQVHREANFRPDVLAALALLPGGFRSAKPEVIVVGGEIRRDAPGTAPDPKLTFPIEMGFERPGFVRGQSVGLTMHRLLKAIDDVASVFGKLP